jgi:hypothetical protein
MGDVASRAQPCLLVPLPGTTLTLWTPRWPCHRRPHHPQNHLLVATVVLLLLPPLIQTTQHQFVLPLITSRAGEEDAWKWLCELSV